MFKQVLKAVFIIPYLIIYIISGVIIGVAAVCSDFWDWLCDK